MMNEERLIQVYIFDDIDFEGSGQYLIHHTNQCSDIGFLSTVMYKVGYVTVPGAEPANSHALISMSDGWVRPMKGESLADILNKENVESLLENPQRLWRLAYKGEVLSVIEHQKNRMCQ